MKYTYRVTMSAEVVIEAGGPDEAEMWLAVLSGEELVEMHSTPASWDVPHIWPVEGSWLTTYDLTKLNP